MKNAPKLTEWLPINMPNFSSFGYQYSVSSKNFIFNLIVVSYPLKIEYYSKFIHYILFKELPNFGAK